MDRVISWNSAARKRPTRQELEFVLEDFFSGAGVITWSGKESRYFVVLEGTGKRAFGRISDAQDKCARERIIEIYWDRDCQYLNIITRHADEFTNALAKGLDELCRQHWEVGDQIESSEE